MSDVIWLEDWEANQTDNVLLRIASNITVLRIWQQNIHTKM